MWSGSERDRLRKLGVMCETLLERNCGNRIATLRDMATWVPRDRDYDELDPERVAQRVEECRNSGARLDLNDPRLKRGGGEFVTTTGRRY